MLANCNYKPLCTCVAQLPGLLINYKTLWAVFSLFFWAFFIDQLISDLEYEQIYKLSTCHAATCYNNIIMATL